MRDTYAYAYVYLLCTQYEWNWVHSLPLLLRQLIVIASQAPVLVSIRVECGLRCEQPKLLSEQQNNFPTDRNRFHRQRSFTEVNVIWKCPSLPATAYLGPPQLTSVISFMGSTLSMLCLSKPNPSSLLLRAWTRDSDILKTLLNDIILLVCCYKKAEMCFMQHTRSGFYFSTRNTICELFRVFK